MLELSRRALYGDGMDPEEIGNKKFPVEELRIDGIPGLFVPADRHQRAAAMDLLFPKVVTPI